MRTLAAPCTPIFEVVGWKIECMLTGAHLGSGTTPDWVNVGSADPQWTLLFLPFVAMWSSINRTHTHTHTHTILPPYSDSSDSTQGVSIRSLSNRLDTKLAVIVVSLGVQVDKLKHTNQESSLVG
mmetsp:Transcript_45562/g.81507  ORF Transcript_45562/g.81507 Transcript_45562/m.81507 type:complete len:125 (+) Transcript_45562:566-940(+)